MMQSGFFMVVLVSCVGTTIALQDSLKEVQASKGMNELMEFSYKTACFWRTHRQNLLFEETSRTTHMI